VIEREYAPATATQPLELRAQLALAQQQIDRIPGLPGLLATRRPVDSQAAFYVWSQTRLSQSRVTSDVELYDRDRALASRFALNVPEYVYRASAQTWPGTSCAWEVFGEVSRLAPRTGACCTPNAESATPPANSTAPSSSTSRSTTTRHCPSSRARIRTTTC
jgi:hypothetical protein